MKKILVLLLMLPLMAGAQSRERLQPGKMYDAGETLYAPRFGFTSKVPDGWSGVFPRESEVFLLTSMTKPIEIFVFAKEQGTLYGMKTDWEKGFDMDENIKLKAKSATIQNGFLGAEVIAVGASTDKSKRGYAAARCSDFGPCVTYLSFMPAGNYDEAKKTVDALITSAKFDKPSNASPYADFDWKKFIGGKTFVTYIFKDDGSKESTIDFCTDGTFKAKISKKGFMKSENPQYKGNMTGTWSAEGVGEKGKLTFQFKKESPLTVVLKIKDEQVFANDERYFVATSEKCK